MTVGRSARASRPSIRSPGFSATGRPIFPAVALWGQPGHDGFRTNVGFWNIGDADAELRLRILDASGAEVWQQLLTAVPLDPMIMPLPRTLDLATATLVVDTLGEWLDCAVYISVVDNITGDAGFQTSQIMDPDAAAACADGEAAGPGPTSSSGVRRGSERSWSVGRGEGSLLPSRIDPLRAGRLRSELRPAKERPHHKSDWFVQEEWFLAGGGAGPTKTTRGM